MDILRPASPEELSQALAECSSASRSIRLGGAFSKDRIGGPIAPADVTISTSALNRVLQYEPRDLTISVQAGLPFAELSRILAANGQMVPLDPPFFDDATVGGVVAANSSGPRRRLYGTARDNVIGMKFAMLDGRIVQSGGMVVKNVAGLDMSKLLIGSFGTLAAMAVVNFKLSPIPEYTRTFLIGFASSDGAIAKRDQLLKSVLQPAALDLVNPAAATRLGLPAQYTLIVGAGGNRAVIDRYTRDLPEAQAVDGDDAARLWAAVREFTPAFLRDHPGASVVRILSTLNGLKGVLGNLAVPAIARAATGTVWAYFDGAAENLSGLRYVIESSASSNGVRWPDPGSDFEIMQRIKVLFDPNGLLNKGRLYGRI